MQRSSENWRISTTGNDLITGFVQLRNQNCHWTNQKAIPGIAIWYFNDVWTWEFAILVVPFVIAIQWNNNENHQIMESWMNSRSGLATQLRNIWLIILPICPHLQRHHHVTVQCWIMLVQHPLKYMYNTRVHTDLWHAVPWIIMASHCHWLTATTNKNWLRHDPCESRFFGTAVRAVVCATAGLKLDSIQ